MSIEEQFQICCIVNQISKRINRKLQSISSVLEVLVGIKGDCPRLIFILPKDGNRYLKMLISPVDVALDSQVRLSDDI